MFLRSTIATTSALLLGCSTPSPAPEKNLVASDSTPAVQNLNGPQVVHLKEGGRMEGHMVDGKRQGAWTSYHPNGVVWSRSTYVDGLENGPTEVFYDSGQPYYKGAYAQGKPSGEWVFFDKLGQEIKRVMHDSTGAVVR